MTSLGTCDGWEFPKKDLEKVVVPFSQFISVFFLPFCPFIWGFIQLMYLYFAEGGWDLLALWE